MQVLMEIMTTTTTMMIMITRSFFAFLVFCLSAAFAGGNLTNPNIGFVADIVMDMHDADGRGVWRSNSMSFRSMELIISQDIDPYAQFTAIALFFEDGMELHEASALFPYLPFNTQLKAGLFFANFGKWSQLHAHSFPFVSEPRMYHEYNNGNLLQKGVELSWLMPTDHYIEWTIGAYEQFNGDSHDEDPFRETGALSELEQAALDNDCYAHGQHYHCGEDDRIVGQDELLSLAGNNPTPVTVHRSLDEFAYGSRVTTQLEFGEDWSAFMGMSGMYQHAYLFSQISDRKYAKLLYGADLTIDWHPLAKNQYRNLQISMEYLATQVKVEEQRAASPTQIHTLNRQGAFVHLNFKHDENWSYGTFGEAFETLEVDNSTNYRYGAFITYNLSHFQYIRLEYDRYEYKTKYDGTNRFLLQYDLVIGHHEHGRVR